MDNGPSVGCMDLADLVRKCPHDLARIHIDLGAEERFLKSEPISVHHS